ncbi:MAG: MarR family transcriptional regulator [Clostridia bacterium]|nr:MarR family transcriptional regulator [Clostridia bacterium]
MKQPAQQPRYDNVAFTDLLHQVSAMYTGTKKPHDYGTGEDYTHTEVHLLKCIADHPGITVTEIAYDYAKTKGAISQVLKKLIDKDLILQKPSQEAGDKRIFLYLTPRGEALNACHIVYDESHSGETMNLLRQQHSPGEVDIAYEVLQTWLICRRKVHERRRLSRKAAAKQK